MKILIENLTFFTIIGILENERITPQQVIVDCIIDYTYCKNNFINYAEVSTSIEKTLQDEKFYLIEEALEHLGTTLKNSFPLINELHLTIRKPTILQNCTVGVQNNFIF
ncbi:MAG: dihydroneopterin aldolase [Sulfuricurvum sp.]|nr:dihydroneopterin aldolase [Sulfuricurvum sp.]MDD5386230.1 dihydroneopterin aldolase [Sulfuricurvum sp.]